MVSVIMGVLYKKADTSSLFASVQSILNQSYKNFEFLIQDDGSSPEAISLLSTIAKQDHRIRLIRESGKLTLPEKLNECLKHAKGEYIARMDDDDVSFPERFEKQVDFLEKHSEISFVGANIREIRERKFVRVRYLPEYPNKEDFLLTQPFVHPTLMFRRSALEEIGGYSESKRQLLCEDYDLLLRLYENKKYGANLQQTLMDYTVPAFGEKKYKIRFCMNEAVTRYERFKALGMLPERLPYVVKPLVVGVLPPKLRDSLKTLKNKY